MGVADADHLDVMAQALATLGAVHSLMVHRAPAKDEISPLGPTRALEIRGDMIEAFRIIPKEIGCAAAHMSDLTGGSACGQRCRAERFNYMIRSNMRMRSGDVSSRVARVVCSPSDAVKYTDIQH